ncbi:MAG: CBS domain-containing protein [Spirochaetales bacterium]|nr:CBS domain-containing protein [Leptospiraceae bacterium]MCP5482455.1 CBS domain-containing protein [Spirochaetales bacterium]MCP5485841.1 CBS domain-containing protein [Spirochaetales bacterium]
MTYQPLHSHHLSGDVTYHRPDRPDKLVTLDDPAETVMTDLTRVSAVTIGPRDSIATANQKMFFRGIRMLLVVDSQENIVGLITATDILSEKPFKHLQVFGGVRDEILVKDLMTPRERIEVLPMEEVAHAKVGHLVETLKEARRQHGIVVEKDSRGQQIVRGLLSASEIARRLGQEVQTREVDLSYVAHNMTH